MKRHFLLPFSFALALSASAYPLREWDWHMPAEHYKNLEFSDRATLDRAVKIFQQAVSAEERNERVTDLVPRYRAAAGEFRKVQVQGEAEDFCAPLLAYAVFMQGYARQQARDRNEAVKLYNEVLDLYPEQKFVAVAARYLLARTYREMGDVKRADATIAEIVDDRDAEGHVLFFSVLRDRAWYHWNRFEIDDAIELWSRIVFSKSIPGGWCYHEVWRPSRDMLVRAAIVNGDFDNLEKYVFAGIGEDKRKERCEALSENACFVRDIDRYDWNGITDYLNKRYPRDKKASERKKATEKIRKGYASWFAGQGGVFEANGGAWAFQVNLLRVNWALEKPEDGAKRIQKLIATMGDGCKDDAALNGRARWLACELMDWLRRYDDAVAAAEKTKGHPAKLRLLYEIASKGDKWKEAAQYLEEYVALQPPPPPEDLRRAKYDLAWVYLHRTGQYEKAIKLYEDINDPPRSLWGLADAQRAAGKKSAGYQTLTEISSVFPNDAPDAVLKMARWREDDGEKEKAIALYRRLLSHPDWKKSGASSQAHQALERYGIKTGGAMTNEVR